MLISFLFFIVITSFFYYYSRLKFILFCGATLDLFCVLPFSRTPFPYFCNSARCRTLSRRWVFLLQYQCLTALCHSTGLVDGNLTYVATTYCYVLRFNGS
uniref:Uncharacterized protein n=1 Tax=Trypanosoma congolense (strain IL3000) TaxID=1068625 RepID=G0UPF7_TRYCI|nr:hypothetical protein, unlikely [Trypanosoma congolense IL3000]